jgi:hypothetical protein
VHVEVDSMGNVTNNWNEGNITSLDTGVATTATKVFVDGNPRDAGQDLDKAGANNGNGRFEQGTLRIANTHNISPLDGNGQNNFVRAAGINVVATALPFTAEDNDFFGNSHLGGTVTAITDGSTKLKLTITFNDEVPIDWPDFVGGEISIGGGPDMDITAVDAATTTVTVDALRIPYRAIDDDAADGTDVPMPNRSEIATSFRPAYVAPVEDVGTSETNLTFIANVNDNTNAGVREGWKFDAVGSEGDDDFWTVYIRGTHQCWENDDVDPSTDGGTLGIVDDINGQGTNIYMERFQGADALARTPASGIGEEWTVAHEVGHLFNGLHGDLGLMEQTSTRSSPNFSDVTLDRIRSIAHP